MSSSQAGLYWARVSSPVLVREVGERPGRARDRVREGRMQVAAWRTWLCDIWERGVARKEALAYALWTLSPSLLPGLSSFSSSPSPTRPQRGLPTPRGDPPHSPASAAQHPQDEVAAPGLSPVGPDLDTPSTASPPFSHTLDPGLGHCCMCCCWAMIPERPCLSSWGHRGPQK